MDPGPEKSKGVCQLRADNRALSLIFRSFCQLNLERKNWGQYLGRKRVVELDATLRDKKDATMHVIF